MPGPGSYESNMHTVGSDSKKFNIQGKTFNPSGKSQYSFIAVKNP
jgi:hypothetical protein